MVQYDSNWPESFLALSERIGSALNGLIIDIHHVGSTAIPGIIAKPIIDLDIVIANYEVFPAVSAKLATLGYVDQGDKGILDRISFKRIDETVPYGVPVLPWIDHHLYVCPAFSMELKRHIAFRDYLRRHEDARLEYCRIKLSIEAEVGGERKAYADLKETRAKAFVEAVLQKAHT